MITWGEKTLRKTGANAVRTNCTDDNHARIALLTQRGFVAESLVNQHFERSLAEPIPEPQLPSGFTIQHVSGEADVERIVQLHHAAFGTQNMTADYRLSMMRVPEYDSTLDLIVVAPDGQWVAFCMGSISEEDNRQTGQQMGWLDPVGTRPDYRQKGLAKALLLTGLAGLKERDMAFAGTNSATSNVAMSRAADSVEFKVKSRSTWYGKMIG